MTKDPAKLKAQWKRHRDKWAEERRQYHRQYYAAHKEKILQQHKDRYINNPNEMRDRSKRFRTAMRMAALTFYGGNPPSCACCGEPNLEFLAIDHIDGNGAAHRKMNRIKGGVGLYIWLSHNSYPPGFRVLCHNCNMSRGLYGYCPHEEQKHAESNS